MPICKHEDFLIKTNHHKILLGIDHGSKLIEDLNKIIDFIEQLNEVDTNQVKPLSSVTGHNLPIREDVVNDGNKNNDVLENAPEKKSGYFVVPKVIE